MIVDQSCSDRQRLPIICNRLVGGTLKRQRIAKSIVGVRQIALPCNIVAVGRRQANEQVLSVACARYRVLDAAQHSIAVREAEQHERTPVAQLLRIRAALD